MEGTRQVEVEVFSNRQNVQEMGPPGEHCIATTECPPSGMLALPVATQQVKCHNLLCNFPVPAPNA